jgi:ribosomal protein L37AE/L43A
VTFGFAYGRSVSQRSLWIPHDMSSKLDTVYCILVVATAVLIGIIKCTDCGNDKVS